MISGEKIGQLIAEPFLIGQEELSGLKELTEKYPYCSTFRLLYLKGLALSNNLAFEDQLKITSIHSPDREHLYGLIHSGKTEKVASQTTVDTATANQETKPVEKKVESEIQEEEIKPLETPVLTEKKEDSEAGESVTSQPEETAESTKSSGLELTSNQIQEEEEPDSLNEPDELEIEILNKVIDNAYVDTEISSRPKETEEAESTPLETEPVSEESKPEYTSSFVDSETLNETIDSIEEEQAVVPEKEVSFIEWLRIKQEKSNPVEKTSDPEEEKIIDEPTAKDVVEKNVSDKNEIDALLDKFIAEEPTISRPVRDFYSPAKNAKKSVEESDDLVSETLAKIHVMQKNYSKAISAYEKLILLYPEKKAFFASQIEKIEEEIKKR